MESCPKYTPKQLADLEKFGDRLLQKYNIDIEFTRHFGDRMSDSRNQPCIKATELQQLFKKIQRSKGKEIAKSANSQAVLNDLQSDLNLPVIIDVKPNGEFEVRIKTIMRKKDFKTPNKKIKYEMKESESSGRAIVDYEMTSPAGKKVSVRAVVPPVTEKPAKDKYELNRLVNQFTTKLRKQGDKFQDVSLPGDKEHKEFFKESRQTPPNYRKGDFGYSCGNCNAFDPVKGACKKYGDFPVSASWVCDTYVPITKGDREF